MDEVDPMMVVFCLPTKAIQIDRRLTGWDYPTMRLSRLDGKKRIVLPDGKPGDVMLIEESVGGGYTLKRIEIPSVRPMSQAEVKRALKDSPLKMAMDWKALKKQTREG